MKIIIITVVSDQQLFEVQTNWKVSKLMNAIEAKIQIPAQYQRLTFKNILLEYDKKIQDYKIVEWDHILLTISVPGGAGGAMFNAELFLSKIKEKFKGPQKSQYCSFKPGLNLEGVCRFKDCQAYQKKVMIPKGFGYFNMSKEIRISKCPGCQNIVKQINNIHYFATKIKIQGLIDKGQNEKQAYCFEDQVTQIAFFFPGKQESSAKWNWMEIRVKQIE